MTNIVKRLSMAARVPGAPSILGEAAQEIIRQSEEIGCLGSPSEPVTITAQELFDALCEVNDRQDVFYGDFVTKDTDLTDVILDGRFDLEAVAEVLTRKTAEKRSQ